MISNYKKELIAIEVIRTLLTQFEKFPESEVNNRNAPFHEAFLNAFSQKLNGKVESIKTLISLASWMHGLNTSLGQSFLENTAHILSDGEKKKFSNLKISDTQKNKIEEIITGLTNGNRQPNLTEEDRLCMFSGEANNEAPEFTADIFYEDENSVVCIESKTVKPNKDVFRIGKQKILGAKAALKNIYTAKQIKYFLGFPFDPLSEIPTGYDKQRFMRYSVNFTKFFDENEVLLSSEFWNYLSGEERTMETILEIINAIASIDFIEKFEKIQSKDYSDADYLHLLEEWFLFREKELATNNQIFADKINLDKIKRRYYNQSVFKNNDGYNSKRYDQLKELIP